jgi:hypothetical protein
LPVCIRFFDQNLAVARISDIRAKFGRIFGWSYIYDVRAKMFLLVCTGYGQILAVCPYAVCLRDKLRFISSAFDAYEKCVNQIRRITNPRSDTKFYGGIVFFLLYQARKYVLMSWYCNSFIPSLCPTGYYFLLVSSGITRDLFTHATGMR